MCGNLTKDTAKRVEKKLREYSTTKSIQILWRGST